MEFEMNNNISRRTILKKGCAAVTATTLANSTHLSYAETKTAAKEKTLEWRNHQPGMSYRRLGRTGYMVSEIIMERNKRINVYGQIHEMAAYGNSGRVFQ